MSEFQEQPDPSFDEQLRTVRIPPGLLARLRQIANAGDMELDAALCNVPMPAGLARQLRQIPDLPDVELDRRLGDVHVPHGLLNTLRQITGEEYSDAEIDEVLRDVPVPQGLVTRARRASDVAGRRRRLAREFAVAASLFIAIGLSYFGAITGFIIAAFREAATPPKPVLVVQADNRIIVRRAEAMKFEFLGSSNRDDSLVSTPVEGAQYEPLRPSRVGPAPEAPPPIAALPIEFDLTGQHVRLMIDVAQAKWGRFLASQLINEEADPIQTVDGPRPGGLEPVFAKGYDARFAAKHGLHPFVSIGPYAKFRTSRPPLTSTTFSYEQARRDAFAGRRADNDSIRIEEFLAAPDYPLPKSPRGKLLVHMTGGVSPFAGRPKLIQVAMRAGDVVDQQRSPVHLVIAVDVSSSMAAHDRLSNIRHAIKKLVDRLKVGDRISLIAFNEEAIALAEQLGRRDRRDLFDAVGSMKATGATNLGAALQEAYSQAHAAPAAVKIDRRIVVLGDGQSGLTPEAQNRAASLISTAVAEGIGVRFVDHSLGASVSASVAALARLGGCDATAAATTQQLDWALMESLTGRSQVFASDVAISVEFNPAVVTSYRLIGHATQLLAGAKSVDLRDGQVVTALYEVETRDGHRGWLARARATWRDPATGTSRRSTMKSIDQRDIAEKFASAAPSLQLAAIAAEIGEALRQSARNPSPLVKVSTKQAIRRAHDKAALISASVLDRPQNERLIEFLRRLRKMRNL